MTAEPPARRVLIADPVAGIRGWLAAAAGVGADAVTEVSLAWEVLWHLAHHPCDIVIVGPSPHDVPAAQLVAMVRTTGLPTPFAVVGPLGAMFRRRQLARMAPLEVVEDWSDWKSLRRASQRLLRAERSPVRGEQRARPDKLLAIAARVVTRAVAK